MEKLKVARRLQRQKKKHIKRKGKNMGEDEEERRAGSSSNGSGRAARASLLLQYVGLNKGRREVSVLHVDPGTFW